MFIWIPFPHKSQFFNNLLDLDDLVPLNRSVVDRVVHKIACVIVEGQEDAVNIHFAVLVQQLILIELLQDQVELLLLLLVDSFEAVSDSEEVIVVATLRWVVLPHSGLLILELVEKTGVGFVANLRNEGRRIVTHAAPVHPREPGMSLDLGYPLLSQSSLVVRYPTPHQVLCPLGQLRVLGDLEVRLPHKYLFAHLLRILGVERWPADEHLEQDRPQRPPVDGPVISGLQKYFGGNVVNGSHFGVGPLAVHWRHVVVAVDKSDELRLRLVEV